MAKKLYQPEAVVFEITSDHSHNFIVGDHVECTGYDYDGTKGESHCGNYDKEDNSTIRCIGVRRLGGYGENWVWTDQVIPLTPAARAMLDLVRTVKWPIPNVPP